MRKLSIIPFSFLYLILVTGLTVNIHYCLGEIESVSIFSVGDSCCCEDSETPNNCCNDDQLVLQFTTSEQLIESKTISFKIMVVGEIKIPSINSTRMAQAFHSFGGYEPPPPSDLPLWLKNSTLTYYG